MDGRDLVYDAWASPASPWAAWVKPVLFAHVGSSGGGGGTVEPADVSGVPAADGATGVVADLPGAVGVAAALGLARLGYRPVPLYNAVPAAGRPAAVDVAPIVSVLAAAAGELAALPLPTDAPPAFLLDAGRRFARVRLEPGVFDNRSVSLPTDFPSADRLAAAGVRRVVLLVGAVTDAPQPDLAHTLRRWQDGGIRVLRCDVGDGGPPRRLTVHRPGGFRRMWHTLTALAGLRHHPLGGFGGTLPVPSAG